MKPTTRLLAWLAKIAGSDGPKIEPRDQLEYYLDRIADPAVPGNVLSITAEDGDLEPSTEGFSQNNVYFNVGKEFIQVNVQLVLSTQLASNASRRICDIPPEIKAITGSTYVVGVLRATGGKTVGCVFNTWENNSYIELQNSSGGALAVNSFANGNFIIART